MGKKIFLPPLSQWMNLWLHPLSCLQPMRFALPWQLQIITFCLYNVGVFP